MKFNEKKVKEKPKHILPWFREVKTNQDGSRRRKTAKHCLWSVCAGVLGPTQEAVPGDPHQQGDRGVQQTVLRLGC